MKRKKYKTNKGITLIALIITIIVLLILAGITIAALTGENGLFKRAREASFKHKMAEIAEEWDIKKTSLIINDESTERYAGKILKEIIVTDELEINENSVEDIRELLKSVGKTEEEYVIIHEGELYYVSQSKIKNNADQVKWCQDLGIKIWDYVANTGMAVVNGNYESVNGVYMCTPQLNMGFKKENTRYLKLNN